MATKHETTTRYPASADVVLKMMTDRSFHERKLGALGLTKYQILDHTFDGQDFSIKIERKVPVQAPGMVKKAVAPETTVVSEESWNLGTRSGRILVSPQGMPIEMACEVSIADDGSDSVVTHRWNVHAKIPVVGATLEKFIVSDMDNRAAEETRVSIELLQAYR